jgi:hypothetical protein
LTCGAGNEKVAVCGGSISSQTQVYFLLQKAMTKNFLMVQAPGFIRGINPKSKIQNPKSNDGNKTRHI